MHTVKRLAVLAALAVAATLSLTTAASALTRTVPVGEITGAGPTALTNPTGVAVDPSSHDVYVTNPPINQRQTITIDATGGELVLSFKGYSTPDQAGRRISYGNVGGGVFTQELEKLPSIGEGNVKVVGPNGGPLTVEFLGALGAAEQPLITVDTSHLTGGTHSANVAVSRNAVPEAEVEKFTAAGEFVYSLGSAVDQSTGADLCTAASHDTCQPGGLGSGPGSFTAPNLLAVDPTNGDFYVADNGDDTVSKYDSSGTLLAGWGTGGQLGFSGLLQGVSVDRSGDLFVLAGNQVHHYTSAGSVVSAPFSPEEERGPAELAPFGLGVDAEDHLYAFLDVGGSPGRPLKFSSFFGEFLGGESIDSSPFGEALALDPVTNDLYLLDADEPDFAVSQSGFPDTLLRGGQRIRHFAFNCSEFKIEGGCPLLEEFGFDSVPLPSFGESVLSHAHGVAVDTDGTVYVTDTEHARLAVFKPALAPQLTTSTTATSQTTLTLNGDVDPGNGGDVAECQFEYGPAEGDYSFGTLPCEPSTPYSGEQHVHADLSALTALTTYHYRLLAANSEAGNSSGDQSFRIPLPPSLSDESASEITSDSAAVNARIVAGGGPASYYVEYLTVAQVQENEQHGEEEFANAQESQTLDAGSAQVAKLFTAHLDRLQSATPYRYRVVVENELETVRGAAKTFTTQPFTPAADSCPNAHVRQQTSAEGLLDCRAYELVSAANAGGYDVESSAVPGQTPFGGYPNADGRVLYGVHNGGIPGTGQPTNRGVDPYVATRGESGWSTKYVGIPANGAPSEEAFGSPLLEADASLGTFAFGGPGLCSPCFADGSTGVPVRQPGGELLQGMVGPEGTTAKAESQDAVAKHLSADGGHLVFASVQKFTADGNEGGDLTIYDRDLQSKETHVVSKTPGGATMSGSGIAELDISANGSHILIGREVGEDGAHNPYYHLYMDVGDAAESIDLSPTSISGVLFAGMTENGKKVFFTTKDRLLAAEDEDESADLYMWSEEGEEAGEPLKLLSTGLGGTGNTDSCDPVANSAHEHWNAVDQIEEDCSVVAIGGGGGIAAAEGAAYFLSPEKLDGPSGTQNAPNLYVVRPGEGPHFVATLESALTAPKPPKVTYAFDHNFGSFGDATALAVDHSNGDLYVLDTSTNLIERFDSTGNPVDFTAGAGAGSNKLSGAETPEGSFETSFFGLFFPTELAVDQSNGDFYVPDLAHSVVDKFSATGEYESSIPVADPTAAAVDPANGDLYVSSLFGSVLIFDSSGNPIREFAAGGFLASVAVDANGTVYATQEAGFGTGETEIYDSSGKHLGTLDHNAGKSVDVNPSSGEVYVDEGEAIARFDSSANRLETIGAGSLTGSVGVTLDPEGSLYATNSGGAEIAAFLPHLAADPRVDNPAVVDSVSDPYAHHTGDFQITPSGGFAVFPSTLALAGAGEEPAGHTELFRDDPSTETLNCVSCSPTGAPATGDAALASRGLSLTEDGRVFFDTGDPLLLADTDKKRDVYEWEPSGVGNCDESSPSFSAAKGVCVALLSAGTSTFDSDLLGAAANANDVYFFTRDSLVPQDENGPTMKVYDARVGGGFAYLFPPVGCRASDECHGPASAAPAPAQVGSESGTPHNVETKARCRRGFVRRHGKCVRRHRAHRHHKHHHPRAGHNGGGGK